MTETRGEKFNSGEYLGHSEGKTFNAGNITIPIAKIRTNPFQPRKVFDKAHLAELAESIKEHGVIEPKIEGKRHKRVSALAGKEIYRETRRFFKCSKECHIYKNNNQSRFKY